MATNNPSFLKLLTIERTVGKCFAEYKAAYNCFHDVVLEEWFILEHYDTNQSPQQSTSADHISMLCLERLHTPVGPTV